MSFFNVCRNRNLYDVLEIPGTATNEEIKRAYERVGKCFTVRQNNRLNIGSQTQLLYFI